MAVRTLTVECPMCKGEIVVDADTGEVLSHKEFKKEVKSFDDFLNRSPAVPNWTPSSLPPRKPRKAVQNFWKRNSRPPSKIRTLRTRLPASTGIDFSCGIGGIN